LKLDKYKIKSEKMGFLGLCFLLLIGLAFMLKITDLFAETVEIEAVVTDTYEAHHNVHTHNPGGPKKDIEWVDLNGEIQTEGNISNREGLSEGDTYTISVDAETQSRRVSSRLGSVIQFVIGIICCVCSLKLMKLFFGITYHTQQ